MSEPKPLFDERAGSVISADHSVTLVWLSNPRGALIIIMANGRSSQKYDTESPMARKEFILSNILTNKFMRDLLTEELELRPEQLPILDEIKEKIEAMEEGNTDEN